jgi:hypothetical protein
MANDSNNSAMVAIFAIIAIIVVLGGAYLLFMRGNPGNNGARINVDLPTVNGGNTGGGAQQ